MDVFFSTELQSRLLLLLSVFINLIYIVMKNKEKPSCLVLGVSPLLVFSNHSSVILRVFAISENSIDL